MKDLAGLKLDLLELSAEIDTYNKLEASEAIRRLQYGVRDIRELFSHAGYELEWDNYVGNHFAEISENKTWLVKASLTMIKDLQEKKIKLVKKSVCK